MSVTVEQLVEREVVYCVSSLVHTLATGTMTSRPPHAGGLRDLYDLTEQAAELSYPSEDWESAALEAGWSRVAHSGMFNAPLGHEFRSVDYDGWQELCEDNDIEPHQTEVYEHWIVSNWLADELSKHGEKVDKDFGGMIVWARTATGQAISQDAVIQTIHRELVA